MTPHEHDDGAARTAAPSAHPEEAASPERGGASPADRPSDIPEPVRRLVCSIPTMAVVSLLGFVAVLWVFTRTGRGQMWDERARMSTGSSARAWAHIVDPLTYITVVSTGACLLTFVVVAVMRRRFALALAAVFIVAAPNVTTQLFKAFWPTSPHWWSNSLPSGHSTVAMSLATAALVVAPAGTRRWLLPLVGFGVTFVGAGTVVGHWHRPADVIAAFLVTTFWAALALGGVQRFQHGCRPRDTSYAVRPVLSLAGSIVVGLVFVALGVRPLDHDVTLLLAFFSLATIAVTAALVLAWISAAADDALG